MPKTTPTPAQSNSPRPDIFQSQPPVLEDVFLKKDTSTNPAIRPREAFPKAFEDDIDWFLKTGQPAPERIEASPPAHVVPATPPWSFALLGIGALALLIVLLAIAAAVL